MNQKKIYERLSFEIIKDIVYPAIKKYIDNILLFEEDYDHVLVKINNEIREKYSYDNIKNYRTRNGGIIVYSNVIYQILKYKLSKLNFDIINTIMYNIIYKEYSYIYSRSPYFQIKNYSNMRFIKIITKIYYDKSIEKIKELEEKNKNIKEIINEHLEYSPGGEGYNEAKLRFENKNYKK